MNQRESNPDNLVRRLQGAEAIAEAAGAARAFGEAQWLEDDELARLCIVIEELVANLYEHGGLTEEGIVELCLLRDPVGIRVSISDPGTPFDPWSALSRTERTDRGGGVGIDIVRAWAHFIGYHSSNEGNRLEFILPVKWEG